MNNVSKQFASANFLNFSLLSVTFRMPPVGVLSPDIQTHTRARAINEQNKTTQNNTKQHKTKHNKTKQNKTKQNKTKQNKTKQNKTKHNKTKQNKTQQNKKRSTVQWTRLQRKLRAHFS